MEIENNTEFEALCARLLPKFNEYLARRSKNIFACELATSLDGINSLPALYDSGGVRKQVITPLKLISKIADEAAEKADTATKNAEEATAKALSTYSHPPYVDSDGYYYRWNIDTETYDKTTVNLTGKAFTIKKVFSSVAAMEATDISTFDENDFILINTEDVEEEDNAKLYVVAVNDSGEKFYSYLVDMSGFRGFTGKTPQMFIGTVTTLPAGSSASASVTSDGTDTDGNPKYLINLAIPKGDKITLADLTAEEIAELQKPATDAIALCDEATAKANTATANADTATANAKTATKNAQDAADTANTTNSTVTKAEAARVKAEQARADAETARSNAETTRQTSETDRIKAETARAEAETKRETDFATSKEACDKATTDSKEQTEASKTQTDLAQSYNDHPSKIGDNGNWFTWNGTEYADTGYPARGGTLYPTFTHVGNKLYIHDASETLSQYVKKKGNKIAFNVIV